MAIVAWPHGLFGQGIAALLVLQWLPLVIVSIDDNWHRLYRKRLGNRRSGTDRRQTVMKVEFERRSLPDRRLVAA